MIHLDSVANVHCVGIKGAGVSGLATIFKKKGKNVCGSDVDEEFFTDDILSAHAIPCEKFSPAHIEHDALDLVVYSTAWKESPEVLAARAKGVPTLSYPEALGMLLDSGYGIAVAGSHGKTTTTGMLAHVLHAAGCDPTALVGSVLSQYGTNAFVGTSSTVVIEADEYENKFQYYHPRALLVTNVDYDHPDYFASPQAYDDVFRVFIEKTHQSDGAVILCGDDEGLQRVARDSKTDRTIWYGLRPDFEYAGSAIEIDGSAMRYTLARRGEQLGRYSLPLIGTHNVSNALGVIALCDALGLVDADRAAELLEGFKGTARRFEWKGERGSTLVYDDFAHHPREVLVTLNAVRASFPDARIWCIFGSHTYSRTKELLDDFARAFVSADRVLVLDIYGSAREEQGTIHGRDLADAIDAISGNASYVGSHERALGMTVDHIDEIDVLITMGAGDVWRIAEKFLYHNS